MLSLLRRNHLVAVVYALLVIVCIVVNRAKPEIYVCQNSVYGIAVNPSHPAPVGEGRRVECDSLSFLKVFDTQLKHRVGGKLRNVHLLAARHIRLGRIWYIAEVAHKIEVAQRSQCKHLRAVGEVVALGI